MDIIELGIKVWAFMQIFGAILGVIALTTLIIIYIKKQKS